MASRTPRKPINRKRKNFIKKMQMRKHRAHPADLTVIQNSVKTSPSLLRDNKLDIFNLANPYIRLIPCDSTFNTKSYIDESIPDVQQVHATFTIMPKSYESQLKSSGRIYHATDAVASTSTSNIPAVNSGELLNDSINKTIGKLTNLISVEEAHSASLGSISDRKKCRLSEDPVYYEYPKYGLRMDWRTYQCGLDFEVDCNGMLWEHCLNCRREFFDLNIVNDLCKFCSVNGKSAMWTASNNMYPGNVPVELSDLTELETMVIALGRLIISL